MAHANIFGNAMLDDEGNDIGDAQYADRTTSRFADQISLFEAQQNDVSPGWRHLVRDAARMLRAVDCAKRDGIELSEPIPVKGCLRVQAYYAPTDRVVRGILNKLALRTEHTCEECGRSYGATYRLSCDQTLCSGCYAKAALNIDLNNWLGQQYKNRQYRERPIIEFASLSQNIQLLIPRHKLKQLRLVAQDGEITYVSPATVKSQSKLLGVMKRYLDQKE